jgi:type IV pilus assembly protein PilY1
MTIFTRMRKLAVLTVAMLLLASAAPLQAAQTSIAQVPLLNITGTGTVKPNLMLLFDNSGSMDWAFLPDSVGQGNTYQCRAKAALKDSTSNTLCSPGHPPFMSSDFNRIYYNPATRYQAPIKYDGSYYPDMTSAATNGWQAVYMDGFSSHALDLKGVQGSSTNATSNLLAGFPDISWCDPNNTSNCRRNTATYTYPDATFTKANLVSSNPYYYTIGVAQFCSDAQLTDCVSSSVGAAAPAGYPHPVKVRWCDNVNLSNCQAKQVGNFKYPSFSTPQGAVVAYGTISIGLSNTATPMKINSVTIPDPTTQRTITSTAVTASTGTDTPLKQQTVASLLASSIMSQTSLTNQYWACVRTPTGTTNVSPCSTYGINLSVDNIVAVIPIDCVAANDKSAANCVASTDASSAGWGITVNAPAVTVTAGTTGVPTTALIGVSGTTASSGTPNIASVTWNSANMASNIQPGKNANAATIASKIVSAINSNGTATAARYAAYVGGNTITPTCAAKGNTFVCLVSTTATSNLGTPSTGALTNGGTMAFSYAAGAGYGAASTAVTDDMKITSTAINAGSAPASTFQRVDIVPGTATYPRANNRTDCVASAASCSYIEEMTNFANWYAYYKTRMQMSKSAIGLAFAPVSGNFRIGLSRMSTSGAGTAIELKPADFTGSARQSWYSTFYATVTSGSTPTRSALDNVGRMFATADDVVQFPCQQNFILLTTDGYWNQAYSGSALNNDNVESAARFCTAGRACVDSRAQSAPSLADVALYWYNGGTNTGTISLRPSMDDITKPGLVAAGPGENTHLHVTTFTMGLGIDGVMNYEADYDTAPIVGGDFYNLLTRAATGCPWNNKSAYVWPDPQVTLTSSSSVQERVDDLWHAAINGHGKYFSASDPLGVQTGLRKALATISVRVGAASAAATSTPNISQQDNDIFADIFTTGKWYGELSDKKIDITTGEVGTTAQWTTTDKLGLTVAASTDTRSIKMFDTTSGALKDFKYASLSAAEKGWFDNKCSLLPQCALLSAADKAIVNAGANIVDWLRGQQQYADDRVLRAYSKTTPTTGVGIPIVLGDIASSKPAFLRGPTRSYTTAGYSKYKSDQAARAPTVFTAANDGMLHAFDAVTGDERWAYVPRITMQKLYKQASTDYSINHQFTTDGSPELGDVQINNVWKTVLVAGLNGGGRGYYALDVTDPANPVALWELCADAALCGKNDPDIGLTFGNPQFGLWQGKWVVYLTSGYNNVSGVDGVAVGSTGQGFLYIVDIGNGTVLSKVSTGNGSTTTPSGFAKITSISSNPFTDPVTTYIYGGDNQGQMFRFDLTSPSAGAVSMIKMGDAGTGQPVTTRPEVTQCLETDVNNGVSSSHAQRVVLFGTGRLLDVSDISDTTTQSLYMLKDSGTAIANIRSAAMVKQTLSLKGSSSNTNTYTITSSPVDLATKDGWYVDWNLNLGERMNLDPQVVGGGINVVTTIPTSSSACSVGGSSNVYQLNVCTGSYVAADQIAGSTLSTSSAAVGFIIVRLPSGVIKMITTTAKGDTITGNVTPPFSQTPRKVGWRSVNGE